jgi:hypothetical protein
MIPKKEPKFKLELTEEEITPRAGLAMYHELLERSGIIDGIDKLMPASGSKRGYKPSSYIVPLMLYDARRRKPYRAYKRDKTRHGPC